MSDIMLKLMITFGHLILVDFYPITVSVCEDPQNLLAFNNKHTDVPSTAKYAGKKRFAPLA